MQEPKHINSVSSAPLGSVLHPVHTIQTLFKLFEHCLDDRSGIEDQADEPDGAVRATCTQTRTAVAEEYAIDGTVFTG